MPSHSSSNDHPERDPRVRTGVSDRSPFRARATVFARNYHENRPRDENPVSTKRIPLRTYFDQHTEGKGIWKWEHYFEAYHRHFQKFIGTEVNVLEIGIYSGGSLEMWRSYFGKGCQVHGVDIETACRSYENEYTSIHIGDQENPDFWRQFRKDVPGIDILIDDGGHTPNQQRVTLEEMLPHLRPGGVYFCEDVHGVHNAFSAFATGLVDELNHMQISPGEILKSEVSGFQQSIHSIHFYPFAAVIEKHEHSPRHLVAPKRGTDWQPFL